MTYQELCRRRDYAFLWRSNPDFVLETEPALANLFAVHHRLVGGFVRRYSHAQWQDFAVKVQALEAAEDGGVIGVNCTYWCSDPEQCGYFFWFLCGPLGYDCPNYEFRECE